MPVMCYTHVRLWACKAEDSMVHEGTRDPQNTGCMIHAGHPGDSAEQYGRIHNPQVFDRNQQLPNRRPDSGLLLPHLFVSGSHFAFLPLPASRWHVTLITAALVSIFLPRPGKFQRGRDCPLSCPSPNS